MSGCSPSPTNRAVVLHGLKRRCELVLNALLCNGASGVRDITTHLQKRFSSSYTTNDVSTALTKLRSTGLVFTLGCGRATVYVSSRAALEKWRSLPKETV